MYGGQVLDIDPQHGDIAQRIAANHLGLKETRIRHFYADVVGAANHVVVGDDVLLAVKFSDHARALATARLVGGAEGPSPRKAKHAAFLGALRGDFTTPGYDLRGEFGEAVAHLAQELQVLASSGTAATVRLK